MALGGSIWTTLGIDPTNEERDIRRAYARRLKEVHPEDDAAGFQALREAYDNALNLARRGWAVPPSRTPSRKKKTEAPAEQPQLDAAQDSAAGWDDGEDRRWDHVSRDPDTEGWDGPDARAWSEPSPPSRPSLSAEEQAELDAERARQTVHDQLCQQLSAMLSQPDARADDLTGLLLQIFRSSAMDSLQTHSDTEYWLARLLSHGGPAADALLEPTIQFFRWENQRIGIDMSHAEPVLRRRDIRRTLDGLSRPGTPGHEAWKSLRTKQTLFRRVADRFDLDLDRQVSELLQRMHQDLYGLEAQLDPKAVATWRARLDRPRFRPGFLIFLLIAPPIIAFMTSASGVFGPLKLDVILALWGLTLSLFTGIGAAWIRGVAEPAQRWRMGYPWDQPLWRRFGWAPAILGLLTVSAWVPIGSWLWLPFPILGAVIAGWAKVVTSHITPRTPPSRYRLAEYIGVIPAFIFVIVVPDGSGALIITLLFAALTFRFGGHAIVDEWLAMSPGVRRKVSGGLIAASLLIAAIVVGAAMGNHLIFAAGLVCALAFADRALAMDRFEPILTTRRYWIVFGALPMLLGTGLPIWPKASIGLVAMLALYLCVGGVLTGLAAVLPNGPPRKKKTKGSGHMA